MGEIEIPHGPNGFGSVTGFAIGGGAFPFTEEHQFESEPFAAARGHITRVIPPFGAKVLMLEMISWKLILIARQSLAILEGARQ
jgi:hypothetical protein